MIPLQVRVDLGNTTTTDPSVTLRGPNFDINVEQNNSIPLEYKDYDDIPTSISDYVLSVTDADNIVEVSIEDINSFLNDQEVYHEYSIQTEGTK